MLTCLSGRLQSQMKCVCVLPRYQPFQQLQLLQWLYACQANYSAAKAGVIGMTKDIARQYAPKRVICNAIAPGAWALHTRLPTKAVRWFNLLFLVADVAHVMTVVR